MIKEAYCSFEVAKLLKEKGFDEPCRTYYQDEKFADDVCTQYYQWNSKSPFGHISTPTHQMAMAWLREEKRIAIIIEFDVTKRGFCPYVHQLDYDMEWVAKWRVNIPMKYEEAVEAALKYSLEKLI